MPTATLPDSDEQKEIDPNESDSTFNDTFGVSKGLQDLENHANGAGDSNKSIGEQEADGTVAPYRDNVSRDKKKNQKVKGKGLISRMQGNKKWLAGGGISVGLISIPVIILALLPLKLEGFIKNITNLASAVPEHATEQRLEYLVTRALATQMLKKIDGSIDEKLVFCKGGAVGCSLITTYTTDFFEKKMGITLDVTPEGRVELGGRAKSWQVSLGKDDFGNDLQGPMRQISKNSEMKALIRSEVAEKGKHNSIITRFLMRKILMKKYGVTLWRGPPAVEKATNKLSEARSNVKSTIAKATVGKISPRLTLYMTCLQETETCAQLRQKMTKSLTVVDEPDPNSENYEEEKKAFDKYQAQKAIIDGSKEVAGDIAEGGAKKLITKRILAALGGGAAAIGFLDIAFSVIGAVGNGALEQIWLDISSRTYTGFSTQVAVVNEKTKLGQIDADTLGATMELVDGAESSPLFQAENGVPIDTSTGITTMCNDSSNDGEKVLTKLEPGQTVCEDQRMVRNYSSVFNTNPAAKSVKEIADAWNGSAGRVFDVANDAIGAVIGVIPGLNGALGFLGDVAGGAAQPMMEWIAKLAGFEPPPTGPDASGPDNYTALSGGLRLEQNAFMEEGVDSNGTAMGAGGTVLTNEQVAAITNEELQLDKDSYNNQPMLAKLFDVSLTGSFAQRLVAQMPTSFSSILGLPTTSFSQMLRGTYTSAASTTAQNVNPFNLPIYGYASDDPALSADPGTYTEAFCKQSAVDRLASYAPDPVTHVMVYTKSDPCALEKAVVGAALYSEGVYDDPMSFKSVRGTE